MIKLKAKDSQFIVKLVNGECLTFKGEDVIFYEKDSYKIEERNRKTHEAVVEIPKSNVLWIRFYSIKE